MLEQDFFFFFFLICLKTSRKPIAQSDANSKPYSNVSVINC